MTPLRQRMIEEMTLRNLAPRTVQVYVEHVAKFAKHLGKSPEKLEDQEVRPRQAEDETTSRSGTKIPRRIGKITASPVCRGDENRPTKW
jgi:hypothetical protein